MELALSNDLVEITAEISIFKHQAGQAVFEIGKRLKHVKENDLVHGQWMSWLESVDISHSTAKRMIQAYEQFGNSAHAHHLPTSKIFEMLSLPESIDRQEFITTPQTIPSTGEQKMANDMTREELREVKKALQEAQRRAAEAEAMATAEKNTARHYEKLWQQEKNRAPVVQTKTEVIEKVPDDYQFLKDNAEKISSLNSENITLQRANQRLNDQINELKSMDNARVNIREMNKYLKEMVSQVNTLHRLARLSYELIPSGHAEGFQAVTSFLREFDQIVTQVFQEWKKDIEIKAS